MNSTRKNFIFFTKDGFTFDIDNKEISNMQILGDGFGNDILEAFKKVFGPTKEKFVPLNKEALEKGMLAVREAVK